MKPITDEEALRQAQWCLAKLVSTTLFWSTCLVVIAGGGAWVVAQRGSQYVVPLLILLFTFGSGAWFWIRETRISWEKARAAAAAPTR
jgi:hypothetical protein